MSIDTKYDKLRNAVRKTINDNKRMAAMRVEEADALSNSGAIVEGIDIRSRSIGLYQANINLLRNIIEFGLGNEDGLVDVEEETE